MKQIKPEVIGYHRIAYNNEPSSPMYLWGRDELDFVSKVDVKCYGVKSRFRPVYKKEIQ